MATFYYRYISDVRERNQIVSERKILSGNASTGNEKWYTPTRYDDPVVAQQELALPAPIQPIYRVGPIPENAVHNLTAGPRRIQPAFGQPGGGIKIATRTPLWLAGLWSFVLNDYDSSI
jgi:hypothetical protein